jgi:predicted amidophosphoribosyltransferase
MARYKPISDNIEKVTEFNGASVIHPLYQCKDCGHSISPEFAEQTGVCWRCHEDVNNIGEYIDKIYSITCYIRDAKNHTITEAIKTGVKKGEYTDEMSEIVEWGVRNFGNLEIADYLVPPPRGTEDADINHMKEIGRVVSSEVGIPFRDPLRKRTPYTSQKKIEDADKRIENVRNNIESVESFDNSPMVVVVDDVATSTGTLKYSAKALLDSGAGRVVGLVIARSERIEDLVRAEVYCEDNNGD